MSHSVIIGESAGKKLLDAVSVLGPGEPWFPVAKDKTFHVIITGIATVRIQVSNDISFNATGDPVPLNWVTLSTISVTKGLENNSPWKAVRANVTAFVAGTVTVILGT